jgi:cytochrome bd-type quinol oxidase subunit 2
VPPAETRSNRGVVSLLVGVYAVLTLAALGRSGYQIATKFDDAPLAYSLSAVAAVVYLVATIAIVMSSRSWARRVAMSAVIFEAAGVLIVGTISVVWVDLFPADTVWSVYGQGYLFIPLVLPFLGLGWLIRQGQMAKEGSR